jgi:electron transfer flavoprotein beta subunit
VEGGTEIITGSLPALLTVELETARPRYAPLPQLVRALRQEVKTWGAAEIGAAAEQLGLKGSPTSVKEIFAPPVRKGGAVFDGAEATADFLNTLFEKEPRFLDEISTDHQG